MGVQGSCAFRDRFLDLQGAQNGWADLEEASCIRAVAVP